MNRTLLIIFFITIITLIIFLIQQNLKDKEKVESQLNEDTASPKYEDDDAETGESIQ